MTHTIRRHLRPVAIYGFVEGDIGYMLDPNRAGVQYQIRVSEFKGNKCTAIVILTRHRETVDGVDQGVWLQWNTPAKHIQFRAVHMRQISKSSLI